MSASSKYALPDELITPNMLFASDSEPEAAGGDAGADERSLQRIPNAQSGPRGQSMPRAKGLAKSELELTKTDRNRMKRWKRQHQAQVHKRREDNLRHAAVVKQDKKAQAKLDVAHAERRLKALKNVKFLVGKNHRARTMRKLDSGHLNKALPKGKKKP